MSHNTETDRVAARLACLGRDELTPRLLNFPSRTRLDFTADYLSSLSTEELRHLLFAAIVCLCRG